MLTSAEYNYPLGEPTEPVINVGTPTDPVYLPPEVCDVVPGQIAKAKLSSNQMANMISLSASEPGVNARHIQNIGFRATGLDTTTCDKEKKPGTKLVSLKCIR